MISEQLCMGCMRNKGKVKRCPYCEWEETPAPESSYHLPFRTVLSNHYLVGRGFSEGKYSITYVGYDLRTHQKLAIKEYLPSEIADRSSDRHTIKVTHIKHENDYNFGLGKFIEEGMALEIQKNLPGLVRTTALVRENGTAYRVMEYIEGPSLEEFLEENDGRISFRQVVRLITPVMIALEKVYESYLLHYDICPENIIVEQGGIGRLVDFTATRFELAHSWNIISSVARPGYSPIEFYGGDESAGPWSDVYSLAATIYNALTGQVPPEAPGRKQKDDLIPPSGLDTDISTETEAVLLKALALNPADRYQSIHDFKEDILESWYTRERKKPSIALNPFTRAKCPYCGVINEVLVTDLKSGTTGCFACHHPLIREDSENLPELPDKPDVAGAPRRARKKKPSKARGITPAKEAFTVVSCPACRANNEVLISDLGTLAQCNKCGAHLVTPSEAADLDEVIEETPPVIQAEAPPFTREKEPPVKEAPPEEIPAAAEKPRPLFDDEKDISEETGTKDSPFSSEGIIPGFTAETELPETEETSVSTGETEEDTVETEPEDGLIETEAEEFFSFPEAEEKYVEPETEEDQTEPEAGEFYSVTEPEEQIVKKETEEDEAETETEEDEAERVTDEFFSSLKDEEITTEPEKKPDIPKPEEEEFLSFPEADEDTDEPETEGFLSFTEAEEEEAVEPETEEELALPKDEETPAAATETPATGEQEYALEEIRRILYGEEERDDREGETPAAVEEYEEESASPDIPEEPVVEETTPTREKISEARPEEGPPTAPMTPLDCPVCQTRNFFTIDEILAGVKCKKCYHQFFTEAPLEEKEGIAVTRRERLARRHRATRKFPAVWIVSIIGVVLLLSAVFIYTSQKSSRADMAAYERYVVEGDRLFGEENYSAARNQYESALVHRPDETYLLNQIRKSDSLLVDQQKISDERRQQMLLASQLDRADSLFALGEYNQARYAYQMALVNFPDDSYILNRLSEIDKILNPPQKTSEEIPAASTAPVKRVTVRPQEDLQKMIDAAGANSIVQLGEGIFHLTKPLVIQRPLELKGKGPNHTLLVSSTGGSVVEIQNASTVKISGIGFEYQGEKGSDLVHVKESTVNFNNCLFRGAVFEEANRKGGNGILFEGGSQGSVQNSRFHNNQIAISIKQRSRPSIVGNEIWNNYVGIQVSETARPTLSSNRIRENFNNGVAVLDQAQPVIKSNQITENKANGLFFYTNKFSGSVQNNQILNNRDMGVLLANESQPTLEENKIKWNGLGGIQFNDKSGGIARSNEIQGNKHGGIKITNTSKPSIKDNLIKGNQGDGIEIMDKAAPTVDGNEITQNNGDGISLLLMSAGGYVSNNTCKGNQGYGISILKPARPSLVNNKLQGNFEGNMYEEATAESQ